MVKPVLTDFTPLLDLEKKLLDCARLGISTSLGQSCPSEATLGNRVRADFLRFLLLGGDAESSVHERGIELCNAWIEGTLDLHSLAIKSGFRLSCCHFTDSPNFEHLQVGGSVSIINCSLPSLDADHISVAGNMQLDESKFNGYVFLQGAHVKGNLSCARVKISSDVGVALAGTAIKVEGDVVLDKCEISGVTSFHRARIGNGLSCKSAKLTGVENRSFIGGGAKIGGTAIFESTKIIGEVRLLAVQIGGDLDFENAELISQAKSSVSFDRACVLGNVRLCEGFSANGAIRFPSARIEGNVYFDKAKVIESGGAAIVAEKARIDGDLDFGYEFVSRGSVQLNGIHIKGDLGIYEAQFDGDGIIFSANGIVVENSLCILKMKKPLKNASFQSSRVERVIDDKESWGENVFLNGFVYGSFAGDSPTDATSRIAWLDKQPRIEKNNAGIVFFDPQPWRQMKKVLFDMGHSEDARQVSIEYEDRMRKAGLIGQSPPHRNFLAAWLNRKASVVAHRLFGVLIGYGYRPAKLVAWLCVVWLSCGALYWQAALHGIMAPSNPLIFQNSHYKACLGEDSGGWYLCNVLPEEYTGFSPLAYSMDVLLPFVDLQQEKDWAPKVPTPKELWYLELSEFSFKHVVRIVLWFEIIFGWVAGVLLVAVVSGLTKRTED